MIVATLLCGPGDHVWLPHSLAVRSKLAARVCVVIDRCPQAEAICRRFPKVECRRVDSKPSHIGQRHDGPTWSEGYLRQVSWDFAAESKPQYILLGDADEVPTPAMAWWMLDGLGSDDTVDCWYADWLNLIHDVAHAIGGPSAWSYQVPTNNKKGMLVRVVPGREYRYDVTNIRHTRMEPNPLHPGRTIHDERHRIGPVPLVHYRWAAWERWGRDPMSKLAAYTPWPPKDAKIVDVSRDLLWRWDADELVDKLPGPIAIVGNGPMTGKGDEIDRHKTIIRFNNWRTEGYERHVGARTDVWVTNCFEDVAMREWTGAMLTPTIRTEQYERNSRWLGTYPHMAIPARSWTDAARELKPNNPSTGLVLLHRLAQTAKRIDAYGFSGLSGGHYWNAQDVMNHGTESAALAMLARRINFR